MPNISFPKTAKGVAIWISATLLLAAYAFGTWVSFTRISTGSGVVSLLVPPVAWYRAVAAGISARDPFFENDVVPKLAEFVALMDTPDSDPGKKERSLKVRNFFRGLEPARKDRAKVIASDYLVIAALIRDLYIGDIGMGEFMRKYNSLELVRLVKKYNPAYREENTRAAMDEMLKGKSTFKEQGREVRMMNDNIETSRKIIDGLFKKD